MRISDWSSDVCSSDLQREAWQIDADRARLGAFADHQIERAILHRGVEHFLDRGLEAVNLVDEEDVAILQIGEERGEIARFGDDGAGGGAETDPHLARDDLRQRGLAEPRRAEETDVIERIAAPPRRLDKQHRKSVV